MFFVFLCTFVAQKKVMEQIKTLAAHYYQQVVEYRRHFHQQPELSGKEKNTADYIIKVLKSLQIPFVEQISGYGVVALLQGNLQGNRTVAVRADMDALPIQEVSNQSYCSCNQNVMHACGHDAHLACLLGVLHILNDLKDNFGGTVKAIFQPSEEEYDGGAPFMIADGVLNNPEVDVIFGQHVTPEINTGSIGIREGGFMASTDEIYLTVVGKGGHAALVNEVINPITGGMAILEKLQQFVKKENIENIPTVLAFGRFIAEGLTNLVPNEAKMAGTLRTFDEVWRENVLENITKIAQETALQFGASCEVNIRKGYPVLTNDPEVTRRVKGYACDYLGEKNVIALEPRMTAEDFAYYLQKKPGTFFRLGTRNETEKKRHKLHSNNFDIDESALETGVGLLSWIVMNELITK